jgi:hypothetical protein
MVEGWLVSSGCGLSLFSSMGCYLGPSQKDGAFSLGPSGLKGRGGTLPNQTMGYLDILKRVNSGSSTSHICYFLRLYIGFIVTYGTMELKIPFQLPLFSSL